MAPNESALSRRVSSLEESRKTFGARIGALEHNYIRISIITGIASGLTTLVLGAIVLGIIARLAKLI